MGSAVQPMLNNMYSILFVCLGNICRSPAAEGILLHLAKKHNKEIHVESCGIGDWHVGQLPDQRMRKAAKIRGITLTSRAQQFDTSFFTQFDYILAADKTVFHELQRYAKTPEQKIKIQLIMKFSKIYQEQDIPDPYYYGQDNFELVMDMLEDACQGLLERLNDG